MCSACYVGEPKRSLKVRIDEHQDYVNKGTLGLVANHIKEMSHMFDWENLKIVDHESIWQKSREMLFINTLNKKKDTLAFFHIYKPITVTLNRFCS